MPICIIGDDDCLASVDLFNYQIRLFRNILLLSFAMIFIVCVFVTACCCYFSLDHRNAQAERQMKDIDRRARHRPIPMH